MYVLLTYTISVYICYYSVLCGRRKGNVQLFGCPWSAELDKDDNISNNTTTSTSTPITNRSLLVRTAQRALYSQCLLHIPITTTSTILNGTEHHCYASPGLVKLCELNYHRPAETIKGKLYPEQVSTCPSMYSMYVIIYFIHIVFTFLYITNNVLHYTNTTIYTHTSIYYYLI